MRIALDHSKILKEIMSEGFRRGIEESVIPALSEKFGTSLECVMMYEDHLSENFMFGGYCYYPLTVALAVAPLGVSLKSQLRRPTQKGRIAFSLKLFVKLQRPSSR